MEEVCIFAVVMAGGVGTRFWPKSRRKNPKQFLKLLGKASLLDGTLLRIQKIVAPTNCFVVTNKTYHDQVVASLGNVPKENIILEPANKETVSCVALAVAKLAAKNPRAVILALPADHYIGDEDEYLSSIQRAITFANTQDAFVTLGVKPTEPKTGYGYIKYQQEKEVVAGVFDVEEFTEKPDEKTAEKFLQEGNYLWNSGIFAFSIPVFLAAVSEFLPAMQPGISRITRHVGKKTEAKVIESAYRDFPKTSIDYGLMEKVRNIVVIPTLFIWDDVGSWNALEKYLPKDDCNNSLSGGKFISVDTSGCIIDSEAKLIAAIGVKDLIIIQSGDCLLICHKSRDQEVKKLVEKLKTQGLEEYL
jgi:mannose-1-phosphate guanylyltransferase